MLRVCLSQDDLKQLLSGDVIEKSGVKVVFKKNQNTIHNSYSIKKCQNCKEPLLQNSHLKKPKYCNLCISLFKTF